MNETEPTTELVWTSGENAHQFCTLCEGEIDSHEWGGNPTHTETQYSLHVRLTGGYMDFMDCQGEKGVLISNLCHDCAVLLFKFLGYKPEEHKGIHPDRNDGEPGTQMCCDYAWRALPGWGDYSNLETVNSMEYGFEVNNGNGN